MFNCCGIKNTAQLLLLLFIRITAKP